MSEMWPLRLLALVVVVLFFAFRGELQKRHLLDGIKAGDRKMLLAGGICCAILGGVVNAVSGDFLFGTIFSTLGGLLILGFIALYFLKKDR